MPFPDDDVVFPHQALFLACKYIRISHPTAPLKVQDPAYWISAAKNEIDTTDVFAPWTQKENESNE